MIKPSHLFGSLDAKQSQAVFEDLGDRESKERTKGGRMVGMVRMARIRKNNPVFVVESIKSLGQFVKESAD